MNQPHWSRSWLGENPVCRICQRPIDGKNEEWHTNDSGEYHLGCWKERREIDPDFEPEASPTGPQHNAEEVARVALGNLSPYPGALIQILATLNPDNLRAALSAQEAPMPSNRKVDRIIRKALALKQTLRETFGPNSNGYITAQDKTALRNGPSAIQNAVNLIRELAFPEEKK